MKLRSYLVLLVVVAVLPVVVFAGVMIVRSSRQQIAAREDDLVNIAHAISLNIDREISGSIRALESLATSPYLDTNDLEQFDEQARRVLQVQKGWETIVLTEPSGQQVVNTRLAFGAALPRVDSPFVNEIFKAQRAVISNLFSGSLVKRPLIAVGVPVIRGGKVRYSLATGAAPGFFAQLLIEQKLPPDWLATIIDRDKIIIARTQNLDQFLGQPAGPRLAAISRESEGGFFQGMTREGVTIATGFRRSELSDWTVAVGIPVSLLEASARRSFQYTAGGGLFLLFGGVLLAVSLGRRVARPISVLAQAAEEVGRGKTPDIPLLPVAEVDRVARELERAATRRAEAERTMRRERDLSEAALNGLPGVFYLYDENRSFLRWNKNFEQVTGYSGEEIARMHPLDFFSGPGKEAVAAQIEEVFANGASSAEAHLIAKDGARTPYYFNGLVVELDGKRCLIGVGIDMTERKQAEERIRALHEIDLAITSTLDLSAILDILFEKILIFLPYSAAARVWLLDQESGEVKSIHSRNLVGEEEARRTTRSGLISVVLETKATLAVADVQEDPRVVDRAFFRNNELVSYLGIPLEAKGETLGVLAVYTKEKHEFGAEEIAFLNTLAGQAAVAIHNAQLYEEMVKANNVKSEFLSIMSHELKTPLNVVIGYTSMMREKLLGDLTADQEKALQKVHAHSGDLLDMVNGILNASQIETGRLKRIDHTFSPNELLSRLQLIYSFPLSKPVSLRWEYPDNLPEVTTDYEKLNHILQNLIHNAIKFTDQGSVTVSARSVEEDRSAFVEFKVADTGIGIAPQNLGVIFEMFKQLDSSETRVFGGVGLGLYIVKRFTEILGGTVKVESEPGKGSIFTVTIPRGSTSP